ncbi:translation initiation factor IF3-1, mitochondrial [Salvia hispanica]|uniref:translation initiation factor IF3-1, mitochondrial n=1 Tax=Salvia hispanica TaxID=49212 RepID=UPI002009821D|nr:translation initiation factor IF3-1, mitochondrial [Salvia hispanica]
MQNMVLWRRLRESRFIVYAPFNDFRRFYNLNPAPASADQLVSSRKSLPILYHPKVIAQDEQWALFRQVRFYARPIKKKMKDDSEPTMNEEITAPTVRLVIDEEHHIIVSRHEALARAKNAQLDLVEVDKTGKPPVCKIFDYNRQRYIQHAKEKERAKSKSDSTLRPGPPKELRFGVNIKENDLKVKADMAKKLMEKGYRVKCTAADANEGVDLKSLLSKFTPLIDDVAVVESGPKYEKKQAFVVVRHIKYGPANKSSGKKASATTDSPKATEASAEDAQTNKSNWDTFDGDDGDVHPIFEIDNVESGHLEPSKHTASSIPSGTPKPATETPQPVYPPRVPVAVNGRGAANTADRVASSPNLDNQTRFDMNTPPRMRPGQQVEVPQPAYPPRVPLGLNGRGTTNTPNRGPPSPNEENQTHFGMNTSPRTRIGQQAESPRGIQKQGSSSSTNQNLPPKSYGIFSVPKAEAEAAAAAPAADRHQQNVPPAVASSPTRNPREPSAAASSQAKNPRTPVAPSPAADSGQGRYGIFSAEEREKQAHKR